MEKTERFARIYYVAGVVAILLFLTRIGTINQDWYIELGLIIAWMVPLFTGGVLKRFRVALVVVTLYFSYVVYGIFPLYYWIYTAPFAEDYIRNGSPLPDMIRVAIVAIISVSPWAFAFYRGFAALGENKGE